MLNIQMNDKSVINMLKDLNKATIKATASTSTKVARQAATQAKESIREDYNVKTKYLNKNINVKRAYGDKPAKITSKGKGIPMIGFKNRKTKKGIKIEIKKGQSKLLSHTFHATMPNGHIGIFERANKGNRRTTGRPVTSSANLPIKEKYGPGAATLLNSKKVFAKVKHFIRENYKRIYQNELKYFSRK